MSRNKVEAAGLSLVHHGEIVPATRPGQVGPPQPDVGKHVVVEVMQIALGTPTIGSRRDALQAVGQDPTQPTRQVRDSACAWLVGQLKAKGGSHRSGANNVGSHGVHGRVSRAS